MLPFAIVTSSAVLVSSPNIWLTPLSMKLAATAPMNAGFSEGG